MSAPMLTNAGLISIYSTLALTDTLPKNKWVKTSLLVLGATQVVDLINHARNTSEYSDSGKLINYMQTEQGMNSTQAFWAVKGPQIGFATLGTAALVTEGVRIFTNPISNNGRSIRFLPYLSSKSAGLNISGKW